MKERPILFSAPMVRALLAGTKTQTRRVIKPRHLAFFNQDAAAMLSDWNERPLPYGKTGDRLWVRETFGFSGSGYIPDIHFRATNPEAPILGRWYPSIHMRRIDSRITLEITSVRVERLQAISNDDIKAEGLDDDPRIVSGEIEGSMLTPLGRRIAFESLWESINGPGSWDANPWVWVIKFRRLP